MQFSSHAFEINIDNVEVEIKRFLALTGYDGWAQKIEKLSWSKGKFIFHVHVRNNPLLAVIQAYLKKRRMGMGLSRDIKRELAAPISRIAAINLIVGELSDKAAHKLLSRIKSDVIAPHLFELEVAAHYLRAGYDVVFNELDEDDNKSTFDFLVTRNGTCGEIECKHMAVDTGRKIAIKPLCVAADIIANHLKDFSPARLLITLLCDKRLDDVNGFQDIAAGIKKLLLENKQSAFFENIMVAIADLPRDEAQLQKIREESSFLVGVQRGSDVLLIRAVSKEADDVLGAIYERLKHASCQLSRTRPGLLAFHIEGIHGGGWEILRKDSGLQYKTYELLNSETRRHVALVSYSSSAQVLNSRNSSSVYSKRLSFKNPDCMYTIPEDFF